MVDSPKCFGRYCVLLLFFNWRFVDIGRSFVVRVLAGNCLKLWDKFCINNLILTFCEFEWWSEIWYFVKNWALLDQLSINQSMPI